MPSVLSRPDRVEVGNRYMVAFGVVVALLSVVVSAWTFSHGDVVTALSALLYVVVGVLFVGIGSSPDGKITA